MWQYHKTSMDHSKIIDTFETYHRFGAPGGAAQLVEVVALVVLQEDHLHNVVHRQPQDEVEQILKRLTKRKPSRKRCDELER